MKISLFLIYLFLGVQINAQSLTEDISSISGNWTGTLTYLDYSDDLSQSTLNCSMTAEWKGTKGKIFLQFEEPNGKIYTDKANFQVLGSGDRIKFDGSKYTVEHYDIDEDSGYWTLIMVTSGKDNYKSSTIRQSIIFEGEKLSLVKEVKYEGTQEFFIRNSYVFYR